MLIGYWDWNKTINKIVSILCIFAVLQSLCPFGVKRKLCSFVTKRTKSSGVAIPRTPKRPRRGEEINNLVKLNEWVSFFQFPRLYVAERMMNLSSWLSKSCPPAKENDVGTIYNSRLVTSKTVVCCDKLVLYQTNKSAAAGLCSGR